MRVAKNSDGTFYVDDEPLLLDGAAAEEVRAQMAERERSGNDEERKRFLAECEQIFRSTKRG